jgi:uncharacterized protein YeaO (DUF488 family)
MRKVKSNTKRGKLSVEEKNRIQRLCETKSNEEIAQILRRPLETIEKYKVQYYTNHPDIKPRNEEAEKVRQELHNYFQWESFKKQFTAEELIMFENSYVELMLDQFELNILPAERKQVFQAITLEIFMARHNRERMLVIEDIARLERMLNAEYDAKDPTEMSESDRSRILTLEGQLNALRQSSQSKTREYKDLSDKYSSLIKELKGTREQRIKNVEQRNEKFTDILKQLEEEEIRNRIGVHMVIMDKAVEKEKDRLSSLHTYMDNTVDQPLLTPETVI